MDAPNEFQPLMDSIFREKVLVRMRGGIRAQFPQFNEEQVEAELYRRPEHFGRPKREPRFPLHRKMVRRARLAELRRSIPPI